MIPVSCNIILEVSAYNLSSLSLLLCLATFSKLILNYTSYNKQLIDLFGKSDPEIDVEEVVHTGESMLYDRAYYYLTQLDTQDTYHIKVLFEEANEIFEEALNKSLVFFEGKEEYEKCAILKGYLDFLNFSS